MRQPGHMLVVLVMIGSVLCFAGCARFKADRSTQTASLQTMQGDLEYAQLQTWGTLEALEELVVAHDKDLDRAYNAFSDSVDRVTAVGERLVRHAERMEDQGRTYLVEPETTAAQCRYPRASGSAGTRPAEIGDAYLPLADRSMVTKRSYREFESAITAIRDLLYGQVNLRVLESATPLVRKAETNGDSLNSALVQALAAVEEARAMQPQPEPAGGTAP